jgi:hypothetical protein
VRGSRKADIEDRETSPAYATAAPDEVIARYMQQSCRDGSKSIGPKFDVSDSSRRLRQIVGKIKWVSIVLLAMLGP